MPENTDAITSALTLMIILLTNQNQPDYYACDLILHAYLSNAHFKLCLFFKILSFSFFFVVSLQVYFTFLFLFVLFLTLNLLY
jgi:hypothetical protein